MKNIKNKLTLDSTGINRSEFLKRTGLMALFGTFPSFYHRPVSKLPENSYLSLIQKHFDQQLKIGLDVYGPEQTAMWLASIDIRKGGQYEGITDGSRRVYRQIHAPNGSTIYWDQPALAAARLVTDLTGNQLYGRSVDKYIKDFLSRSISEHNSLFLWGSHHYYDVFQDTNEMVNSPIHETRPLSPAWPMFWKIDPGATKKAIRAMGIYHVNDPETGEFDRHADTTATERPAGRAGYPFVEHGGILAETLCWLAAKLDQDSELIEEGHTIARFSYNTRSEKTGLIRNQAGTSSKRWDYYECSTEIGLWARCLLRAADYACGYRSASFQEMAKNGVSAYLRYGFDERKGKYYGALNVSDGKPVLDFDLSYSFRPGTYADIWEPLFPTHDYPMSMAEACIDLYHLTGEDIFKEGIQRWVEHNRNSLPANYAKVEGGFPSTSVRRADKRDEPRVQGAYAGDYGNVIHFLTRSADTLNDPSLRRFAKEIADEAISKLYVKDAGMFRSNPERYTCDAVDGIGTLFLALLNLETGRTAEDWGFYI